MLETLIYYPGKQEALENAALRADVALVSLLMDAFPTLSTTKAFISAAEQGSEVIVKAFLDAGCEAGELERGKGKEEVVEGKKKKKTKIGENNQSIM